MKNSQNYVTKTKIMNKKVLIICAIALISSVSFGQSMFDKYEDMKDVTSAVINQKIFSMLASMDIDLDDPDSQKFMEMVKKVESVKILSTSNMTISKSMRSDAENHINRSRLSELMRFKDGEQTVKFYVKEGKDENHVKELFMLINGLGEITKDADIEINGEKREFETVVVSISGDIDLREISKITSKMNVPGGKNLEKVGKKN
jgi:diphthamide synthase (EF-2-diphthine--ammonia ligase)